MADYEIPRRQLEALALYELATGAATSCNSIEAGLERFKEAERWCAERFPHLCAPAPAPVKAEGERVAWALVPPAPTDEMLAALNTGFCVELPQWKAMLAAAPPPPTEEA